MCWSWRNQDNRKREGHPVTSLVPSHTSDTSLVPIKRKLIRYESLVFKNDTDQLTANTLEMLPILKMVLWSGGCGCPDLLFTPNPLLQISWSMYTMLADIPGCRHRSQVNDVFVQSRITTANVCLCVLLVVLSYTHVSCIIYHTDGVEWGVNQILKFMQSCPDDSWQWGGQRDGIRMRRTVGVHTKCW